MYLGGIMKNVSFLCLVGLLLSSSMVNGKEKSESSYCKELHALKINPKYHAIFDADMPLLIPDIYRDIHNYKQLPFLQRLSRFLFLAEDVIVVTAETMPKLYGFIETTCNQQSMAVPTVFITREKGILNAFAAKFFATTGGILICQKMIEDTSDTALEAVIAHELGHIKCNHTNKILVRLVPFYIAVQIGLSYLRKNSPVYSKASGLNFYELFLRYMLGNVVAGTVTQLTIGKQFEKEADEFAYKDAGKGKGLIEFCDDMLEHEKADDAALDSAYEFLQENKPVLSDNDYQSLMMNYYLAKGLHLFIQGIKWVFHNTSLDGHPSPEDRVKAIKEYLAEHS